MALDVVVLGAGFGGLELTTRLSEAVADDVRITLIDQHDSFLFGFSKLEVMFGFDTADALRCHYRDIVKPSVRFRQETVTAIDPLTRRVTTDGGTYGADVLVIALGADYDTAATPGLDAAGIEFYSLAGAERARSALRDFEGGDIVISVLGGFFKCPPAPNEAALMLHDHLESLGVRSRSTIHLTSPLPMPIPISQETSQAITALLAERDITYLPSTLVTSIDPDRRVAVTDTGRELPFDLLLGVPVHRAPEVVVRSGITADDGWIAVDPATFATAWPGVYAVGDITSAPVPRAGAIAEGEAATVAEVLIAQLRGSPAPPPYSGVAACYIESGQRLVATVDVDFFAPGGPTAVFQPPSPAGAERKRQFGATRRARWFGYSG